MIKKDIMNHKVFLYMKVRGARGPSPPALRKRAEAAPPRLRARLSRVEAGTSMQRDSVAPPRRQLKMMTDFRASSPLPSRAPPTLPSAASATERRASWTRTASLTALATCCRTPPSARASSCSPTGPPSRRCAVDVVAAPACSSPWGAPTSVETATTLRLVKRSPYTAVELPISPSLSAAAADVSVVRCLLSLLPSDDAQHATPNAPLPDLHQRRVRRRRRHPLQHARDGRPGEAAQGRRRAQVDNKSCLRSSTTATSGETVSQTSFGRA